jgi:hypothetical protein
LWIRSNQVGRAGAALQSLQDQGIAGPPIIADQGIAYAKDGDAYDARKLFARADADRTGFDELGNNHYDELNEQSKNSNGPEVGSEAQSFSDNYAANMSKLLAHAGASVKAARLQAFGGISRYADHPSSGADQQRVTGREAGLNLRWFLNPRVALESSAGRRYYSGAGDRRFGDNASGALTAQVLAPLKLGVRGGMSDVETASAIQAGITYRTYGGTAAWDPAMNWKVSGSYDVLRFNDANQEHDLRLGLMRQVTEGLTLGPSFLRSDSGRASPEYYTPVSLTQYTGIVALTQRFGGRSQRTGFQPAEAALQYEGGYGTQAGVSRIVNSVKGSLGLRFFDSLLLSLHGQYSKSTSYESRRFDAGLSMGF